MEDMSKKRTVISANMKRQILEKVRSRGAPISEIAKEYGLNPHTIYGWLDKDAFTPPRWLEVAKLKRENKALEELLDKVASELGRTRKKQLIMASNPAIRVRLFKQWGIGRSTLYYKSRRSPKDQQLRAKIEEITRKYPNFGYRRIALCLKINRKKAYRVIKAMKSNEARLLNGKVASSKV